MKNKALYLYRLFNKLIDKLWMGTPVLVLSYHRVNDVFDPNLKQLTVSISNFEKQIAFLKNNFTILRLTDSWKTKKIKSRKSFLEPQIHERDFLVGLILHQSSNKKYEP